MASSPSPQRRGSFFGRFWPVFLLGLVGVLSLPLIGVPMLRADLPFWAVVALTVINALPLLAAAAALGAWLTTKVGLISLVAARVSEGRSIGQALRSAAPLAIGLGLGLAALTVLLDLAFQPLLSPEWRTAAAEVDETGWIDPLIAGLLYGGITEEVMLPWGMMTAFLWAIWRLFQRGRGALPSTAAAWAAILLAAVLFGLAHLPAAAALAPLDGALVLRVVLLNALGGMLFGWLFWRHHLEAAMLAHASAHVGFARRGMMRLS